MTTKRKTLLGYVVELEPKVYYAPTETNERLATIHLLDAKRYTTIQEAEEGLTNAKRYRQFPRHNILPLYKANHMP